MENIPTKSYLFNLSYGRRGEELPFIKDVLINFINKELTGITILVNNNPYNFEFLLLLVFEKSDVQFDNWLNKNYPDKKVNYLFNYSMDDIVFNLLNNKQYSAYTFSTYEQVASILTDESNRIFLFPSIKIIEQKWGKVERIFKFKIFLSHSSNDKPLLKISSMNCKRKK